MNEIIVLGGYGRLGRQCVSELVDTSPARVVVAGRSIQRAQEVASAFGDRARPAYADAADPRTLQPLIPGTAAVLACCGGSWLAALDVAIQTRVPFIALSPTMPEERNSLRLQEQAWQAQVPVVIHAGAIPGLPGVLAELLMRRFPRLSEICIASTGPWTETENAERDQRQLRRVAPLDARGASWAWRRSRVRFPEPIGLRWIWPAQSLDLGGFVDSHCVDGLRYLEPVPGLIARTLRWVLRQNQEPGFALVAEAYHDPGDHAPEERITLQAPDPLTAAAAAAGVVTQRILRGGLPGGFFVPHEALNPAAFLEALAKRGVRVWSSLEAR